MSDPSTTSTAPADASTAISATPAATSKTADLPRPFRTLVPAFSDHRRSWRDGSFRYVYPVVSRRSRGVSIGVNLNPDKRCNFDCVYCQVDRTEMPPADKDSVDLELLAAELSTMVDDVLSGAIWEVARFAETPAPLRRLNDFALSGDGEPTTDKRFDEVVAVLADVKAQRGLDDVKIVLITDAACLHHAHVERGLALMDSAQGEVWAKLDAGTEEHFKAVARTAVKFDRVLRNLEATARQRPIVVQSMFFGTAGAPPPTTEIDAWIQRLRHLETEGQLAEVHVYTVARRPAEAACEPLTNVQLDTIADRARAGLRTPVATFYGAPPKTD